MKFMKASILIMLIMGICLLTACGPKEENTTTDTINPNNTVNEEIIEEFKDKYGNKLPGFSFSKNKSTAKTDMEIQGT